MMPKVEGKVVTPGDTNNRLDPDHVLVTFTPEGSGTPITIEYYYDKGVYKSPWDFVHTNQSVTVKYKAGNPMNYTVYPESKGDYTKYIGAGLIGLLFAFFFAKETEGGLWSQAKVFTITFVVVAVICLLIYEFNARFAWLNFNSKRDDE
jgi:hypothetical protein